MASKRAEILREALEFFETYGDLLTILMAEARAEDSGREGDYHLDEFIRQAARGTAATTASGRTRLTGAADPEALRSFEEMRQHFAKIDKADQEFILDFARKAEQAKDPSQGHSNYEEDLDRYYSAEVVDKLAIVIGRASQLRPIQINRPLVPAIDIQRYFSEAHQCFLYGFPVACAVLCRAVLEAVLKREVRDKFKDLSDYIEAAHARGLLSQENRVWAYEIKDLGNAAIHQYERFARGDLSDKIAESLIKTRAVIEELLSTARDPADN